MTSKLELSVGSFVIAALSPVQRAEYPRGIDEQVSGTVITILTDEEEKAHDEVHSPQYRGKYIVAYDWHGVHMSRFEAVQLAFSASEQVREWIEAQRWRSLVTELLVHSLPFGNFPMMDEWFRQWFQGVACRAVSNHRYSDLKVSQIRHYCIETAKQFEINWRDILSEFSQWSKL